MYVRIFIYFKLSNTNCTLVDARYLDIGYLDTPDMPTYLQSPEFCPYTLHIQFCG